MKLRKAINTKCRECIYDPIGGKGTWRQQVVKCTSKDCPIYSVRPKPTSDKRGRKIVDSSLGSEPICLHPAQLD
jgi:hypothetical protein